MAKLRSKQELLNKLNALDVSTENIDLLIRNLQKDTPLAEMPPTLLDKAYQDLRVIEPNLDLTRYGDVQLMGGTLMPGGMIHGRVNGNQQGARLERDNPDDRTSYLESLEKTKDDQVAQQQAKSPFAIPNPGALPENKPK